MKKIVTALWISLLLASCGTPSTEPAPPAPSPPAAESPSQQSSEPDSLPPDIPQDSAAPLSEEETIREYIERLYTAYLDLETADITDLLDMEQEPLQNMVTWLDMLNQRRNLIADNQLCYVHTQRHPYKLEFQLSSGDSQEEIWARWEQVHEGEFKFHFIITGAPGDVFPPFMAAGAVHTIMMKEIDDTWKITSHYYPGSVNKFYYTTGLALEPDQDVLEELKKEFTQGTPVDIASAPGRVYNGQYAAEYALRYTEQTNPAFYVIEDWVGNCSNFTSQCIWMGFGGDQDSMTADWYAGAGGGSNSWESVVSFWDYITSGGSLKGQPITSLSQVEPGDLLQTQPRHMHEKDKRYSHSLLLIDEDTLLFGQNSPSCFVYYSDLVDVDTRWIRPTTLG